MKRPSIVDISRPLHRNTIIYPGNPPIRIRSLKSATSYLSEITLGSHTGTHVDSPRHADRRGIGIDRLPLGAFIGRCRVLDLTSVRSAITQNDLRKFRIGAGERILLKTKNSSRGFAHWRDDYIWLTSEAAAFLAKRRIALLGVDSLSVKQRGNPDNRPHTELLRRRIPILEGLDLSRVRPGRYQLICLPLKFVGLDGAPARAVLVG